MDLHDITAKAAKTNRASQTPPHFVYMSRRVVMTISLWSSPHRVITLFSLLFIAWPLVLILKPISTYRRQGDSGSRYSTRSSGYLLLVRQRMQAKKAHFRLYGYCQRWSVPLRKRPAPNYMTKICFHLILVRSTRRSRELFH